MADLLSVGVVVADADGSAMFANRAWLAMSGQRDGQWAGQGWLDPLEPEARDVERAALLGAIRAGLSHRAEWQIAAPGGDRRILLVHAVPEARGDGGVVGFVATVSDVTEDRADSQRLLHRATHDALTGLMNRGAFVEFVGHAIDRRRRDPGLLAAVIFVDVDRLKETNDQSGHRAGDRLLQAVADHVRVSVRPADVVARYGGDEFTVLCEDLQTPEEALSIAQRIAQGARPGRSFSVGVAVTGGVPSSADALIRDADDAMYLAKELQVPEPILHAGS